MEMYNNILSKLAVNPQEPGTALNEDKVNMTWRALLGAH